VVPNLPGELSARTGITPVIGGGGPMAENGLDDHRSKRVGDAIMTSDVIAELSEPGTLRAGINLGNTLLVTARSATGDPEGVAPDIARAVAERLGVSVEYVPYATPGEVADAAEHDEWDIALIGAEPQRARHIAFSPAYVEIEATYLVAEGSPFRSAADVDRPGVRIAVSARSAYDLYLERSLGHAELCRGKGIAGALERYQGEGLDALAGLRPALMDSARDIRGTRVLGGSFTTVQQAIGTPRANTATAAFLERFVAEACAGGLVARAIRRHGVAGKLRVAAGR
jgi:polar amino acid transport system substrate-binding protein